jgi:hypothetical protein
MCILCIRMLCIRMQRIHENRSLVNTFTLKNRPAFVLIQRIEHARQTGYR